MVMMDDKAYMASAEVSALLWKEDIIRQKVCNFLSASYCKTSHTALFLILVSDILTHAF